MLLCFTQILTIKINSFQISHNAYFLDLTKLRYE